jgi:hypothetical protein
LINLNLSKKKLKKKKFSMMREKRKTQCSELRITTKCVKLKMDLANKNGSQEIMRLLVVSNQMTIPMKMRV